MSSGSLTLVTLSDPNAGQLQPTGINDAGVIVGATKDSSGNNHGFIDGEVGGRLRRPDHGERQHLQ